MERSIACQKNTVVVDFDEGQQFIRLIDVLTLIEVGKGIRLVSSCRPGNQLDVLAKPYTITNLPLAD